MTKKVLCKELDEESLKKEITNFYNNKWEKTPSGEDFFKKDSCEIDNAEIDTNNVIRVHAMLRWTLNNKPTGITVEITFDKDLNEDASEDDYIINMVSYADKYLSPVYNEDLDTYKVKGSLKEGILYCCR